MSDMQGKHFLAIIALAALISAPTLAGPPAKKPSCQPVKNQPRDAKRPDPCLKSAPIPWLVDPTPLFLASVNIGRDAPSISLS